MIRFFKQGDERDIAELEKECFSSPWSQNSILDSAKNDTDFFVCCENEKIVGYAGIQIVLDEGYVTNVAVTGSHRGNGIGGRLVDTLIRHGQEKNLSFISLEVRSSNFSAISLYSKRGFIEVGKRKNFYEKPTEDAIIMTKELK